MRGALSLLQLEGVRRRLILERLTEPVHLNVAAAVVALFGSTRAKIAFDVLPLQYHAYGLQSAVRAAKELGYSAVTAIEFGVATGRGLLNMASIAALLEKETGVRVDLYGFDSGTGMPQPLDERDHPNLYWTGDFAMDVERLRGHLPPGVNLVLGDLADTIPGALARIPESAPIGYVSIDVDYYSSSKKALEIFTGRAEQYLPAVVCFLDDMLHREHNEWCGELGAVREFNLEHEKRKIDVIRQLRNDRIFKNAWWIEQMRMVHVLDHEARHAPRHSGRRVLANPFLPEGKLSTLSPTTNSV